MKREELFNPHLLGKFMRDVVGRATVYIRKNRYIFEAKEKNTDYKTAQDFVTNIDVEAQEIFMKNITECYPGFGVIAEESDKEILVPCTLDPEHGEYYFTIDPLDGTKAFIRMQSDGIGSMLSLIHKKYGEEYFSVIAVCISDIMTGEMYYYRPGSEKVHRVEPSVSLQELKPPKQKPLKEQYCLLRDHPLMYSDAIQQLAKPKDGLFANIEVSGGSIGTCVAKLWKKQVGAIILPPGITTPWDWNPVLGISQKLGYEFWLVDMGNHSLFTEHALVSNTKISNPMVIIHKSNSPEFIEWMHINW